MFRCQFNSVCQHAMYIHGFLLTSSQGPTTMRIFLKRQQLFFFHTWRTIKLCFIWKMKLKGTQLQSGQGGDIFFSRKGNVLASLDWIVTGEVQILKDGLLFFLFKDVKLTACVNVGRLLWKEKGHKIRKSYCSLFIPIKSSDKIIQFGVFFKHMVTTDLMMLSLAFDISGRDTIVTLSPFLYTCH